MFGQTKLTSESDTGCSEWRQWMVAELPGITGTQARCELWPENQVCPVHHLPRLFPPAGREHLALSASWVHFRLNIFIQRATLPPPSPCPWSYMGIAHPSVPAPPTTCLQWSPLLPGVLRVCWLRSQRTSVCGHAFPFLFSQDTASSKPTWSHMVHVHLSPLSLPAAPVSFLIVCIMHWCTSAFLGTEDSSPFHVDNVI